MNAITWTMANRVGLAMTIIIGIFNIPSVFERPDPGEVGPPFGVLVTASILGVIIVAAATAALIRLSRRAAQVASGANVLAGLLTIPAFFVAVPTSIKVICAIAVVWTIVSVALTLSKPNTADA